MKYHKVLITGGGGFVGTQVAWELAEKGYDITIVDRANPIHKFPGIYRVKDYLEFLNNDKTRYDTIVHLAADHIVPVSVTEPSKYYENNVLKMKAMLDIMVERKIPNIIFSSSGNVYGRQGMSGSLQEDSYYDPENPYASSKVAGELLIKDYAHAYGIKYVTFRYFNAAGADPRCRFGYTQRPATHVIPIMCNKILNNEEFEIFGDDYPTMDGTCIRDYVHIADLARAHSLAIEYLASGRANETFNLGGGSAGVSVRDLLMHTGNIIGGTPNFRISPRRQGDPAILVASIRKAEALLGWKPEYKITDAIQHAWEWEKTIESNK